MNNTNDIPRRIQLDKFCPAETAIYNAMQEVENMAADVRLTDAVNLLSQAKDKVADYIDGVNHYPTMNENPICGTFNIKKSAHNFIDDIKLLQNRANGQDLLDLKDAQISTMQAFITILSVLKRMYP